MKIGVVCLLSVALSSRLAAQPTCADDRHHQFDFWIGKWSVVDQRSGKTAGESNIEQLYDGCVLRENWESPGFSGGSLNGYSSADNQWHQAWMDSSGAVRLFTGGLNSHGQMVLVARQAQMTSRMRLVRMTFTPNRDGSVRQYSDYSDDEGKSWSFRYDFLYRRLRS